MSQDPGMWRQFLSINVNESIIRNQLQQPKEAEREVKQTIYGGRQLWQQVSVPDTGAEFREEQ